MGWWNYFLIFFAAMIILTSIGGGGQFLGLVVLMIVLGGGGFLLARQFGAFQHPNAFINYLHARNFLSQGKLQQALEHYNKALQMNPNMDVARRERDALSLVMENPQLAKQPLGDPFSADPSEQGLYQMRVKTLISQQDYEGVLAETERILNTYPDYKKALYYRALAHQHLENLTQAAQDYETYLEQDPRHLAAYANLAEIYIQLRQPERAKAQYDSAIVQDKRFAPAYAGRGFLVAMDGDYEAALADAEYAVQLADDQPGVYYSRGGVYALMGEEQAAFDDLQYALDLNADYHYAIAAMAAVHQLRKHQLQADAMWKTLVKQDPRYTEIDWVLNRYGWQGTLEQAARELVQRISAKG